MATNVVNDSAADILLENLKNLDAESAEMLDILLKSGESIDELIKKDKRFTDATKLNKVVQAMSPYSYVIPNEGIKYVCLSITNMRDEYIRKFALTGLIGYLYRSLDEYKMSENCTIIREEEITPEIMKKYDFIPWEWRDSDTFNKTFIEPLKNAEYVPEREDMTEEEIARAKAIFTADMVNKIIELTKERDTKIAMHEHCIIKKWLDKSFRYNPDRHVRSAYAPSNYMVEQDEKEGYKISPKEKKKLNAYRNALIDGPNKFTSIIPPRDIFLRVHRYLESNFEGIRLAVSELYNEVPDLDFKINIHEVHDDVKKSIEYRNTHRDSLITTCDIIQTGAWVCLTDAEANRRKVEFYNQNTKLIEEMAKRREVDTKMASEMLNKRVKIKKRKNIKETGPDDEGALVKAYKNDMNTIKMGTDSTKKVYKAGEKINPDDSHTDIDPNLPDDAIQCNVISFNDDGSEMVKEAIFIEAQNEDEPLYVTHHRKE